MSSTVYVAVMLGIIATVAIVSVPSLLRMKCRSCGARSPLDAERCTVCGAPFPKHE